MADDPKTPEAEEEEFVILETPPEDEPKPKPEPDDDGGDDDHEEEEDARLATSDDDTDPAEQQRELTNAEKRKQRRERQRHAREQQDAELAFLRQQVGYLTQRVSQQDGFNVQSLEQDLVRQYHATVQEAQQAERIMAAAMQAQNGEDHTAALRIRDAATQRAMNLRAQYEQLQQQKAQPSQAPGPVDAHRAEWLAANPWFDGSGVDPDSAAVRAIDLQMQQQGLDPNRREYWQELSRRASQHFQPAGDNDDMGDRDPAPRRKSPPQGGRREHAPGSTRREIYVTPERKQAMQEAGVWDDPAKRNRMLKAYADYDRQASGN